MVKNNCNICNCNLQVLYNFGELYISNFIPINAKSEDYPKSELCMMYCPNCKSAQLRDTINPDLLYKEKYWYYSGINQTMKDALADIAHQSDKIKTEDGDIWLDIACNDGTLLSFVDSKFTTVGCDPADKDIIALTRQRADIVINDYFSGEVYNKNVNKRPKIITCIAMFYDLVNPVEFVQDVYNILLDDGVFILQLSYTPLMLRQLEFGNICAEHVMYHTMTSLNNIMAHTKFKIVDCELNDVNGGSIRLYCVKDEKIYGNQQLRDVGKLRVDSFLSYERNNLDKNTYDQFFDKIIELRNEVNGFAINVKHWHTKKIYAYGASTKGNMLLQFFGLDNRFITKIADRNPQKWGLKTIGTEIPICSEEEMRKDHPDYLLILPWYFINEFKERESNYLAYGGKFIVPCPTFEIIKT